MGGPKGYEGVQPYCGVCGLALMKPRGYDDTPSEQTVVTQCGAGHSVLAKFWRKQDVALPLGWKWDYATDSYLPPKAAGETKAKPGDYIVIGGETFVLTKPYREGT